jgi:hypothetical protein
MARSPDERIETLERRLNLWRILAILLILLLAVAQRRTLVTWLDHAENWFTSVANART